MNLSIQRVSLTHNKSQQISLPEGATILKVLPGNGNSNLLVMADWQAPTNNRYFTVVQTGVSFPINRELFEYIGSYTTRHCITDYHVFEYKPK